MASRSRMAPARASGVASDPCAAAMRTMTSAYAAMTRLCSLAYPNHATPPRRRAARAAPVRTRSVRREGAIIAREDLSNTAVRTRGTEASPARRAARCGRSAASAGNGASSSRGRGRPRAPRRPPAVERRGRPPREHANRGSRTVKHGGARRPPGRRWTSATYVSFPRARVPVPSGEVHEDRAALDVDGIPGHLDRGVVDVGAGRDVPAPGVPGAGHHAPVELALAERPAPVGARVVDRVVRAVHVEQGQRLALDLDHPALARRHVADRGDPYPSRLYHRSRSPPSPTLLDHPEAAVVAAHIPEPSVSVPDPLPDPDVLRREREDPERVRPRIEADDGVRLDLVDPHRPRPVDRDGVRPTSLARRQRVFLHDLLRRGVHAHELAASIEGHPERTVGRDRHPARLRAALERELGDRAGLGVEPAEALAGELAEPHVARAVVRGSVRAPAGLVLGEGARTRVEPADPVAGLHGEPDDSLLVEDQRVGVAARGRPVLDDLTGPRIELADRAVPVAGVPDAARAIDEQAVGPGAGGQGPLGERLRAGVEPGDLVAEPHRDIDVAVGPGRRIARELGRGHLPL